ncbi:hypothetical protein SAMN05443575_2399 [Jatrophihabitans endophyticus]|uniref:Uncharacterized protein n=1 Tax=Jatrophihabitans endophyticus TaxID=1206085 RepID=A0A1M5LAC9_9ACTN|nr:hypothetical protein [Jatrophihabitans endophyticus]SHG62052.1 hypothetical protein SAMN05443575_2399 [Jatrophihabitans endophyticus]
MLLIGLLVVAVACVIVGVVTGQAAWLIASLVASVLAAAVLVRSYLVLQRRRTAKRQDKAERRAAKASRAGADRSSRRAGSSAVSGDAAVDAAGGGAADGGVAGGTDDDVVVVDGKPDYHRVGCPRLRDETTIAIPRSQALADGFAACGVCTPSAPDGSEAGQQAAPAAVSLAKDAGTGADAQVWVADGYPEYHVEGCGELGGLDAEPVPYSQAVEDGFQPCVVCNPDATRGVAPTTPPPAATDRPDDTGAGDRPGRDDDLVWVADGFPDYHRDGCARLADHSDEAVPREQAVEDGFTPCAVCRPEDAEPALHAVDGGGDVAADDRGDDDRDDDDRGAAAGSGTASVAAAGGGDAAGRQVWVVDGFPDYHRENCSAIAALDHEPVPHEQAVEDGFAPCSVCRPEEPAARDVVVVDGLPDYHLPGCAALAGLPEETVPHEQAVEDGFAPCSVCRPEGAGPGDTVTVGHPPAAPGGEPDAERAVPPAAEPDAGIALVADAPVDDAADDAAADVLVVDGHPDFHRAGCARLLGLEEESIPRDQALEDGFAPCPACQPDGAPLAVTPVAPGVPAVPVTTATAPAEPAAQLEPEPEPAPAVQSEPAPATRGDSQVWVVEGRPRYHQQDCLIIKGRAARPMPEQAAVDDGFLPCSLCQR